MLTKIRKRKTEKKILSTGMVAKLGQVLNKSSKLQNAHLKEIIKPLPIFPLKLFFGGGGD